MQENGQSRDSIPKSDASDVPHVRRTWKWMRNGVYPMEIPVDTVLDGIHNYNYIFKKSISNTYLGNFPSPYESNIFIDRAAVEDFYPLTFVRAYLFKPEDAPVFNTTTPFTRLMYFTGGGKGKAENLLDVWHVQNIRPWWSAGIRYNLISSDGRYMNQKSKTYNFSIFSGYEKGKTILSLFFNQNIGHFQENGGVSDRAYVTDSIEKAENIPVYLSDVRNSYRNTNFNFQAQYNIGKSKETVQAGDTLGTPRTPDTLVTYPAKVVFNFCAEGNERRFGEKTVNLQYYPRTYIDSSGTFDHIQNKILNFSGKLVVNEHPRYKYLPGIYAGMDYRHEHYFQRTAYDTVSRTENFAPINYTGTYLTAGLFNIDTASLLNYDISARLGILGRYAGNFKIDGFVSQALNKDRHSILRADAGIELKSVNPFFDSYAGNHDIWENDFKAVKTIEIKGRYINTRLRTELGVGITNIYSYVYFDTVAMPQQTGKTLLVLTAWAKEHFKAGNFHFDQSVCFQKSTQEEALSLQAFSVYSHNYYQNHLFKKALFLQSGIDVFYGTEFYSDNYMPSTMQFYNQRKYKTGNHPKVDVFLSFKIKRSHLFVKYEHVNYHLKNHGNFFSAADYPINPGMFKFGLQWDFFD